MSVKKGNSLFQSIRQFLRHGFVFSAIMFFVACLYLFSQLHIANYFPIRTVRVAGLKHIDKVALRDTVRPFVLPGFFSINVEMIRDRLQEMPWVSNAIVSRRWPDEITIALTEKTAAARWNHTSLLSSDGQLFIPKEMNIVEPLVEFVGPDGQQITMLKYFVNINRILAPLHAKISYLELTPYLTWKLTLENGMTLKVGHNEILTRLTHFVKVYPKIVGDHAENIDYIDLRYPNGMAVKWKVDE